MDFVNKGWSDTGMILGMGLAYERGCNYVTPSLIGQAHTLYDPCEGNHDSLKPYAGIFRDMSVYTSNVTGGYIKALDGKVSDEI